MRKSATILVLVLLLTSTTGLIGCQNVVESATKAGIEKATGVSTDGDSVTIKKDGEEVTISGTQEGELPDGFPADFPMFQPLTITSGVSAEANGAQQYTVTGKTDSSFADVQQFYVTELEADGWKVEKSGVVTNGAGSGAINAEKGESKADVMMVQTSETSGVELVISVRIK